MHRTRESVPSTIPISRKGTKYVVRPLSHLASAVPVVIAVRDMLKIARNTREVKSMIHQKVLKLNGRVVHDFRESIKLFNILEADKKYQLILLPTKRFSLEEVKSDDRICKIIGKVMLPGKKIQFNLHDGSNIISTDKLEVNDTVIIHAGKIKKHISLKTAKEVFVMYGKYVGQKGKIHSLNEKAEVKLEDKTVELNKSAIVALQ